MLHLKSFTFNPFQQNTYLVYDDSGAAILFDAGNSSATEHAELSSFIEKQQLRLTRFLLTHAHIDHMMGNRYIHDTYGILPEVHKNETAFIENMEATARMYGLNCEPSPSPGAYLEDRQEIMLGDYRFECILAPGHSPGSICFHNAKNRLLIGGDVLFRESIGRTDLPGGDHETLLASIRTRLMVLPDETQVYCGHGPSTTIGHERAHNYFLRS